MKEIFSKIYRDRLWWNTLYPPSPEFPYYSGFGSHNEGIISSYTESISNFLKDFDKKPDVLDLGCGDFNVGSKIRSLCGSYIATDIVPELIEFNKNKFSKLNVDFRVNDLTDLKDPLPSADVIFVRQVLQHLSNADIQRFLPRLSGNYRWLVITEHVPSKDFIPNIDHVSYETSRVLNNCVEMTLGKMQSSGIILTDPPFNLNIIEEKILCNLTHNDPELGDLRTIAYRLSAIEPCVNDSVTMEYS